MNDKINFTLLILLIPFYLSFDSLNFNSNRIYETPNLLVCSNRSISIYSGPENDNYIEMFNYVIKSLETVKVTSNSDSIAQSVYRIVFHSPDSIISIEQKIDIIALSLKFHYYGSNILRNKIFNEKSMDSSFSIRDIFFILPMANCHHCSINNMINMCKQDTMMYRDEFKRLIPKKGDYERYYRSLTRQLLRNCDVLSNGMDELKTHNLPLIGFINSKELRTKYPQLLSN